MAFRIGFRRLVARSSARKNRFLHSAVRSTSLASQAVRATTLPVDYRPHQLSCPKLRSFSSPATFDHEKFTKEFLIEIKDVVKATDPAKSSQLLRRLVCSGVLKYTDMSECPEKFFLAHRLLATVGLSGFGIRFTVQFNLFAGSIVGLGGADQVAKLHEMQKTGSLGCFLLTEMQAGVLSGLIVKTTADWDSEKQQFVLHTPNDAAAKNWISQGYTAELGVVVADLRVDGVSHGPHPFLMQLREDGKLCPGIRIEDMGGKTVANDLDNARVWFDKVQMPKEALLTRFAEIRDDKYHQVGDEPMRIEVIGQRLMTGRQCIAEAALVSARVLHEKTEKYAQTKVCNGLVGEVSLASMPQVAAVFDESYAELDHMIAFTAGVGERLAACLRDGTIPSDDLVDAIAVCKIRAIDVSVQRVHALRQEVGSYALMDDTGFELVDMFLCCKFAEGDSRILQMKLARDRLKQVKRQGALGAVAACFSSEDGAEARAALQLARKLQPAGRDLQKLADVMHTNWRDVYALADLVADRIERTGVPSAFVEGTPSERIRPAEKTWDADWKEKV